MGNFAPALRGRSGGAVRRVREFSCSRTRIRCRFDQRQVSPHCPSCTSTSTTARRRPRLPASTWRSTSTQIPAPSRLRTPRSTTPNPRSEPSLSRLVRILAGAAAAPRTPVGDLDLLDDFERESLVPARGATASSPLTLPDILRRASAVNPDAPALVFGDREVSYRDLDAESNTLARELINRGVGPGTYVALALSRSLESVTATWAVAKTGGAFLPIDPHYPEDRIRHMLTDSGAVVGISVGEHHGGLADSVDWLLLDELDTSHHSDAPVDDAERRTRLSYDDPAYLIYTSGSTGVPQRRRGQSPRAEQLRRRRTSQVRSRTWRPHPAFLFAELRRFSPRTPPCLRGRGNDGDRAAHRVRRRRTGTGDAYRTGHPRFRHPGRAGNSRSRRPTGSTSGRDRRRRMLTRAGGSVVTRTLDVQRVRTDRNHRRRHSDRTAEQRCSRHHREADARSRNRPPGLAASTGADRCRRRALCERCRFGARVPRACHDYGRTICCRPQRCCGRAHVPHG